MKKAYFVAAILVLALAAPSLSLAAKKAPSTPDKTYSNGDYKFRLNYPGAWNYEESEKPKIEAGYGINIPMGKMGNMCNVKFAENLKDGDLPNINLMVMPIMESKGGKSKKDEKKEEKRAEKAKKEKQDCVVVEQKSVNWAGQKAMLVTTRCPETKKVAIDGKKKKATVWRYMTAVNMKRSQDMYNLVGQMLCTTSGEKLCDDMPDKGKAAEFDKTIKPARDKMIATTKFTK